MIILVINCGSSSLKYQLIEISNETLLCSGLIERIGEPIGALIHKLYLEDSAEVHKTAQFFADHDAALEAVLACITGKKTGAINSVEEIEIVGHRVAHGGELLQETVVVGEKEKKAIRSLFSIAPLHNPANLQGIEVALKLCPQAPSVAVLDTGFHASMPEKAFRYALPENFYTKYGIRRYGFHGSSHKYVSQRAAVLLKKPLDKLNLITCHLGNGCSITAVRGGKSVDTTMGFTPTAGVMMGTRVGDLDPAVPLFMISAGFTPEEVENILNKQSGLKGICGMNDLRDILAAMQHGDIKAILAFDMFCYGVKRQIGALWAVLGQVDGIVFTAGIGENCPEVRAAGLAGLESWGVKLDSALNSAPGADARLISAPGSKVAVAVIPTNEELEIARAAFAAVQKQAGEHPV